MSRTKPTTRCIYVIGPDTGLQKVGLATDPRSRLATLQTASPYDLVLHASVRVPADDAPMIERRAHRLLIRSCVRNEWFETSPEQAVDAVQAAVMWAHERRQPKAAQRPMSSVLRLRSPYRSTWRPASLEPLLRAIKRPAATGRGQGALPLFGGRAGGQDVTFRVGARFSYGAGAYPTTTRLWDLAAG